MIKKLITISILSLPALLNAQGFQVNLQGQTQQGMGGAGTGLVQDAAAVFFNPGGVSFLKENTINAGATATIATLEFGITTLIFSLGFAGWPIRSSISRRFANCFKPFVI